MINPLLVPSVLPNAAPAFDRIKSTHYLPAIKTAIEHAREQVEALKAAAPSFAATIEALETCTEDLDVITSIFYNQLSAFGGDDLHALAEDIGPILATFTNDIALDPVLFEQVKAVWEGRDTLTLTPEQTTLLENTYKGFVRGGALLGNQGKARLRDIDATLSTLGPTFMNNVNKSAEAFTLLITDKTDLSGLPESAIESAAHASKGKGWLFTLDMPSYAPFLQFADNRTLREKMWRAYTSRGWGGMYDNAEIIRKIVSLRHERAVLLGYATHADYVLEERMARTPAAVEGFIATLKAAYKPAAKRDIKDLADFAGLKPPLFRGGQKEILPSKHLMPWDTGYYAEKLRQKRFAFSSEDLRPYFPLEQVLNGIFVHFEKLFGLRFVKSETYPVWHEDVQVFDVYDDAEFMGTLYGDFYPRTGKKDGAWKTTYRNGGLHHGKIMRPLVSIVCNFTKPTATKPSLLTHGEVETLLHEMGHAVHALLSKTTYRSLAGTSVLWDFVELPSQLQENWGYERETLDMLGGHFATGAKIPQDLVEKLRAARNFMGGMAGLRQVSFATLDMAWHEGNSDVVDVAAFEDRAVRGTTLFPRLSGPSSAAFSHIFAGGYSAGYYSYKWAQVLEADAFEAFLEKSLYDRTISNRFKIEVLSKGGSERPDVLYHRFRGRDADPKALLRREGLIE